MRTWGERSQEVYDELDERLQRVMLRVRDEVADISLLEGFRDQHNQDALFDNGFSKVRWPDSKHNTQPSLAVDFQPYPLPESELHQWASLSYIAGALKQIAKEEGVTIRWGGDWDSDGSMVDQRFFDLYHVEIVELPNDETSRTVPNSPRVSEPRRMV